MTPLEIVGTIFIVIGCVFALTGAVGVLRMPDFYTRLHPAGKSDTLAQGLILLGLALFAAQSLIATLGAAHGEGHGGEWIGPVNVILKLVLLTLLLFLTAPTATHAIAKAARLDRHTKIPVENDPGASRVAEIVVVGDIEDKLEEPIAKVLDVREDDRPAADDQQDADADNQERGDDDNNQDEETRS